MGIEVVGYEIRWPALAAVPDGAKPFLAWGPRWGYHFDDEGNWRKGKVCRACVMAVPDGIATCPKCGGVAEGQHGGLDKLTKMQTPLDCPVGFTAIKAGWHDVYGNRALLLLEKLAVRPDRTKFFPYLTAAHLHRVDIVEGRRYPAGTRLGVSGCSGNTGTPPFPHTHLQLEEFGVAPRRPMHLNLTA